MCVHVYPSFFIFFLIQDYSNVSPVWGLTTHSSSLLIKKKKLEGPLMAATLLWGVSLQDVVLSEDRKAGIQLLHLWLS